MKQIQMLENIDKFIEDVIKGIDKERYKANIKIGG